MGSETNGEVRRVGELMLGIGKILGVATVLAGIVAAAAVGQHQIGNHETRIERVEVEVEAKASAQDLEDIRRALGALQLDVGLICAEVVTKRGGDPLRECRTAKGIER